MIILGEFFNFSAICTFLKETGVFYVEKRAVRLIFFFVIGRGELTFFCSLVGMVYSSILTFLKHHYNDLKFHTSSHN